MRRDDIGPLIENAVKGIVVCNIEDRDGTASGAGVDMPAYALRFVTGNPRPERLPRLGQFGRPFRPRRRDNQKQHDGDPSLNFTHEHGVPLNTTAYRTLISAARITLPNLGASAFTEVGKSRRQLCD